MKIKGANILVTGGSGFIGSHITDLLVKRGANVKVLCRGNDLSNIEHLLNDKIELVKMDLRFLDDDVLDGVDAVIHTAGHTNLAKSSVNPWLDIESTTIGSLKLLKAMYSRKVSKIIFLSSGRVYGMPNYVPMDESHPINPVCAYGVGKVSIENYCNLLKRYGLNPTILRVFSVYGPRQVCKPGSTSGVVSIFADRMLRGEDIKVFGDGSLRRDFINVVDVAECVRFIIDKDYWNLTLNVGSGSFTTMKELAELIKDIAKSNSSIIYDKPLDYDVDNYANIDKLVGLGFKPRISLRQGISGYVYWLKLKLMDEGVI